MSMAILHPDVQEFDALVNGGTLVLVDFWAEWCMPCRMLSPVIEQLSEKYADKLVIAKVNVDEQPELAARFRVQSIPTVLLLKNGAVADTQIGLRPLDTYVRAIDALLG